VADSSIPCVGPSVYHPQRAVRWQLICLMFLWHWTRLYRLQEGDESQELQVFDGHHVGELEVYHPLLCGAQG
jgi:hypothetical protein